MPVVKSNKSLSAALCIFAVIETVLGVLLQTLGGRAVPITCFASVVLACLFCTLFAEKTADYLLTQLALVCTVSADFFLLITPERQQLPAMLFFSVTQLAYFLRIWRGDENGTRKKWHLAVRAAASILAVALTFAVLGEKTDAVAAVSMFYYANLLTNIVFAFACFEKPGILAVGLVLFALCDALIGMAFLDGYLPIAADSVIYKIIHPGFDLAWAFYLPAQALLAASLAPRRFKENKKSKKLN